ncbi:MAG: ABC transporter permease [Candidatus Hydrogenedentes bacterium]|nr:ABC transporter permease [Candidatus Hydrogenedentota bacterium]
MKYFLDVFKEEINSIFGDPGVLLIFIAGLAVYTLLYPLPYLPEVLKDVRVAVIDEDNTSLSRKLARWIDASEEVKVAYRVADFAESKRLLEQSEIYGVLIIPRNFEKNVLSRQKAVVQLFADATYFLIYRQIFSGVYKAVATMSAGVEIRRLTAEGFVEKIARNRWNPVPVDVRPLFNPAGGYATYVVPAVLMLILQQTLLIAIGMLSGTRQERLEPLPVPEGGVKPAISSIILARGLVYFAIYISFPVFYIFVVYRIYQLEGIGNIGEIILFLVPYVSSIILLGFTLCAVLVSRELSIPALLFTSLPAVLLVGFAWPLEAIPGWLRVCSLLLPSTSGSAGFVRLHHMGASLYEVRWEWFTLWVLNLIYFGTAWVSLRLYQYRVIRSLKKTL